MFQSALWLGFGVPSPKLWIKKNLGFVFLCTINDDFMKLKFYSNEKLNDIACNLNWIFYGAKCNVIFRITVHEKYFNKCEDTIFLMYK